MSKRKAVIAEPVYILGHPRAQDIPVTDPFHYQVGRQREAHPIVGQGPYGGQTEAELKAKRGATGKSRHPGFKD